MRRLMERQAIGRVVLLPGAEASAQGNAPAPAVPGINGGASGAG
jgi:hypothetical protein